VSIIAVQTDALDDGAFLTRWKWKTNPNSRPYAGTIRVTVDLAHKEERLALAEIQALHYLLEIRKVQGENRIGAGLRIHLSSAIVRKALLKGALKTTGAGKSASPNVAAAATFLATKYFEVSYEVQRWREEEPKAVEFEVQSHMGLAFPRVTLPCKLLDAHVFITRHAMNRWVARISENLDSYAENDLTHIADSRWAQAWRWFENVLSHKGLLRASLLPKVADRYRAKFGPSCEYLEFWDASALLVMVRSPEGLELVTVIRINPHIPILQQQQVMQKLRS
jgi:hypothetical protein